MNDFLFNKLVKMYKADRKKIFQGRVDQKVKDIAEYIDRHGLAESSVIVGISGGIDSAVVWGLLNRVREDYFPTLTVRPYCVTFSIYDNAFEDTYVNDMDAHITAKVGERDAQNKLVHIEGDQAVFSLMASMGFVEPEDEHTLAQVSYALRYQMFFAAAQKYGGITFGTTNRDEFEYSGWFGKTSDMVVDIQPIANWHKFEVIWAAEELGIPQSIIDRTPQGDLIDLTSDEENFGCTYDELSYFTAMNCVDRNGEDFFQKKFKKLIDLHNRNKHKYQGQTFNPVFIR